MNGKLRFSLAALGLVAPVLGGFAFSPVATAQNAVQQTIYVGGGQVSSDANSIRGGTGVQVDLSAIDQAFGGSPLVPGYGGDNRHYSGRALKWPTITPSMVAKSKRKTVVQTSTPTVVPVVTASVPPVTPAPVAPVTSTAIAAPVVTVPAPSGMPSTTSVATPAATQVPAVVAAAAATTQPTSIAPQPATPAPATIVASIPATQTTPSAPIKSIATPPAAMAKGVTLVLFDENGESLSDAATGILSTLAASLKDGSERIQLKAYAGEGAENNSLARRRSLKRALSVRSFLMDNGIRPNRIDVRALGVANDGLAPDRVEVTKVEK